MLLDVRPEYFFETDGTVRAEYTVNQDGFVVSSVSELLASR